MFIPHLDVIHANSFVKTELEKYRNKRKFDAKSYLDIKALLINNYFSKCKLKGAVIGISGGIDSITSYFLLKHAMRQPNSQIEYIVPISLIASDHFGVTGHLDIVSDITSEFKSIIPICNTNEIVHELQQVIENSVKKLPITNYSLLSDNGWTIGQSTAHVRTTVLAGIISLLQANKIPSIMIGTTNKDEYSYIGYFGKYSDGLNDLQIISDLHKSEVYKLASLLQVPDRFIKRVPTGDMYVNCSDEEVFGVDYDCLEIGTQWIQNGIYPCDDLSLKIISRIQSLNNDNRHKYGVGTPTHCIDIMNSGNIHGKELNLSDKYYEYISSLGYIIRECFVNPVMINSNSTLATRLRGFNYNNTTVTNDRDVCVIHNAINNVFIDEITDIFDNNCYKYAVHADETGHINQNSSEYCSQRLSLYDPLLADKIWHIITKNIDIWKIITKNNDVFVGDEIWIPVGINPLMRFINYVNNGVLVPHYDQSFVNNTGPYKKDTLKSLYSVVIYVQCDPVNGTVFFEDAQSNICVNNRDLCDKSTEQLQELHVSGIYGQTGAISIFPHHLLHGSKPCHNKLIIRTDIMFEKVSV